LMSVLIKSDKIIVVSARMRGGTKVRWTKLTKWPAYYLREKNWHS